MEIDTKETIESNMIARVLHGTSALLIAISLCGSGSLGAILRNCQPEDGKIHDYGDTVYVQPANDPTTIHVRPGGNLYKKPFIFTSPCDVSFKAISLLYSGTCSVSVSYGSDDRVLDMLQFSDPDPDLLTRTWNRRNVSLTNAASESLHGFMTSNNTSRFLITISPGISNYCQLYKVDHKGASGLIIIGQDINECVNGTYACRGNRKCVNTVGSYFCRCLDGYNGSTCQDIDECQNGKNNCNKMVNSDNRQCQNLNGSYHCPCLPGYAGSQCDDINECANGAYACRGMANPGNRKCVNTVGSYYCRCLDGFTGSTCIDINECANGAYACRGMANPGNRKCVNTVGSYYCRCLDGFTGSTCIDIDECQNGKHNCNEMVNSDNRQCQNLNGSYHCPCLPGYAGSQCDGGFVSIVTFAISISLVVVVSGLTISILIAQLKRKYTKAAHMRVQTAALQNTVGTAGSNALSLTGNDAYGTTTSGDRQDPSLYDTIQ
ncbi:fibrillin-2-like isoform X2 [Sycon ciliatum]|uniref:fibrillin-2-like isoform X2 n=1 Tax=Sycon ciliatum TaxID=27933 RepID=UPI0031F61E46